MNRPDVVEFLARHHWVASTAQLQQLGVSKSALHHARATGLVESPVQGVIVVRGVELALEGRAVLAQLAAGGEAFVSGPTAAVLHGVRAMPTQSIEITVKQTRRLAVPDGCRLVRASWIDEDRDVMTRADGIRVATPLRMLFGLAAQFNQHSLTLASGEVVHLDLAWPSIRLAVEPGHSWWHGGDPPPAFSGVSGPLNGPPLRHRIESGRGG